MSSYYLPHEDPAWERAAERASEQIRDDITDHLHNPTDGRPFFVGWLEDDGLDAIGSPLTLPAPLTEEQAVAHAAAVDALIGFLECLDIDIDLIERRVEQGREDDQ